MSLLTLTEAHKYLRICRTKLYDLMKTQRLPVVRIGARVYFHQSDLDAFAQSRVWRPGRGRGSLSKSKE